MRTYEHVSMLSQLWICMKNVAVQQQIFFKWRKFHVIFFLVSWCWFVFSFWGKCVLLFLKFSFLKFWNKTFDFIQRERKYFFKNPSSMFLFPFPWKKSIKNILRIYERKILLHPDFLPWINISWRREMILWKIYILRRKLKRWDVKRRKNKWETKNGKSHPDSYPFFILRIQILIFQWFSLLHQNLNK